MGSRQVTVEFVGFDRSQTDYSLQVIKDIALGEAGLVEGSNPEIVVCTEDLVSLRKVMQHYPETTVRILFNAELGSLDFNTFDYVIGWEELSDVPRYARLHPGLSMEASPFGSTRQLRFLPRPMRERDFCCFIATNSLAHPMRDEFFRKLNELKRVDSWGRHLNNSGTIRNSSSGLGYELEKLELESGYKFTLALENGLFAGYLTEKVFSGAKSGAIPIYWGNPKIGDDVNLERILSLHEFESLDAAITEILTLEKEPERLEKMAQQPIMTPDQELRLSQSRKAVTSLFLHAAETARQSRLLRPIGTTTYAREYVLVSALRREEWVLKIKATISRIFRTMGLLDVFFKLRANLRAFNRRAVKSELRGNDLPS